MAGASAACASAADQVAAVSVPRPADSHGGRLWALSVCDPCSAIMINRLSVFWYEPDMPMLSPHVCCRG